MAPQKPPTSTRRRSSSGIRRPKVAGSRPETARPEAARPEEPADLFAEPVRPATAVEGEQPSGVVPAEPADPQRTEDPARPAGSRSRRPRRRALAVAAAEVADGRPAAPERGPGLRSVLRVPAPPRTRRGTVILAGVTVVLLALAALGGVSWWTMRHTPAARNTALVDVAATARVSQQLGDAVRTVYSYDFTRLDQNEAAARAVITPEFGAQFDQLFGEVRSLAPQQQAVVTATVSQAAVESITGDRAVLLVFLDQQATRAAGGQQGQQLAAAGRLTVTGELVDGTWKIADVAVA